MFDWYLGEAGFGEQLQRYDAFWQQIGQALLWASILIFAVLMFVAVVVTLSRRAEMNKETGGARRLPKGPRHTGAGGARAGSGGRAGARPRHKAA
jgi:hypothetical protein